MMSNHQKPTLCAAACRASRAAFRYVPLFLLSFAMIATGFAQSTGSIRGQVKNATTGKLVYNAVVTIDETGRETTTDEYGVYRFSNVPNGEYTISADYVGMRGQSVSVSVDSGVSSSGDILMVSRRIAEGTDEENVFELDAFEIDGSENYDANAMALNEQRRSDNLISVQHADAFGEIAEGNIGEYLKNLPGVSVNYVAADVRSIKMRGMSPAFTQVTVDGSQMASAGSGSKIRAFELEQVSLANVEHLEVSKLPRPDMSANAIGGSVNLVSKNAFALGKQFNYKVSLNFNSEETSLGSTPGWNADAERSKVLPGVELNYSDVFMEDRLGLALTYKQSNMFNVQQRFRWREWETSPEGDVDEIYFKRLEVQDGPKKTSRESFSANMDFKVSDDTMFTLKGQVNYYDSTFINRNVGWRAANLEADEMPAGYNGSTEDLSDNSYTFGQSNGLYYGGSFRGKYGNTYHIDAGMKHHKGQWDIDYGYTMSEATNHYDSANRGFMATWEVQERQDNQYVEFDQGNGNMNAYSDITVYDSDMNELPNAGINLDGFELRRTRDQPKDAVDRISGFRLNARRNFSLGETQGYFQFGVRTSRQEREAVEHRLQYVYNGYNTDGERIWLSDFKDEVFSGNSPGFGYGGIDWPSANKLYDIFTNNMSDWTYDETYAINHADGQWFEMEEDIDAAYAMAKFEFLDNRLSVLAGARYEDTKVSGAIPVIGSANNYVRSRFDYGFETTAVQDGYDGFHPSVHLKYDVNDKFLLRLSYANTIGRPDFGAMYTPTEYDAPWLGSTSNPNDADWVANNPDNTFGIVEVANPGLLPRESDNIDITAEYYYDDTGVFSVSVFQNKMENFISRINRELTAADAEKWGLPAFVTGAAITQSDIDTYGLEDEALNGEFNYRLEISENVADATIEGLEVNWKQDLDLFTEFLRGSSIYANGTFLSTNAEGGTAASDFDNNFDDFAKKTINYGYLFERGPVDIKLRWNIRGDEIGGSSRSFTFADGRTVSSGLFREERKSLDFDFGYKFSDRAALFVNARNLNEAPHRQGYFLANAAGERKFVLEREERFGVQWTVGVKGKF
ncbi:TonB-dependent receptor [Pelagicoccus sp. SDUM812002]|uniref:TonB-dependent receptor n=1 Tax=Pelagicoccus sp. SDUM812002 TaxID=3041266 RepID=UPI00280CF2EF|nr:TonB-dependent receptor [Pelagicoccus sp. SDUM812002]MDQ8185532.1 TonB-dependent receptor [Pelagicoccus sp. SDUM812002]